MGFWNGCGRGRFEMVTARVRGRISGANRGNWTVEHAKHAHFSCGAGKARPIRREFGAGRTDHEESVTAGDLALDLGRIWTTTMLPRWHSGHGRSEWPVRSS